MAFDPTTRPADLRVGDARLYELATGDDEIAWRSRSRIILSPMAAPSIMGLFGFAVATVMVGAWQAGWYGGATTGYTLWPFALFVGGIPQLIAAMYALRARDGVAVAVHTVWGAFWMGWSVLMLLMMLHVLPAISFATKDTAFAWWFVGLAVVTISAFFASVGNNLCVAATLGALAAGSCLTASGFWSGNLGVNHAGGYVFVAAAALAWYTATAMMLEHAYGRTVLPLGLLRREGNVPGSRPTTPIAFPHGMPGVKVGQ